MYAIGLFSEHVPEINVTWLLWVALGFFAVMVVVGWLVSRKQNPELEAAHVSHERHEVETPAEVDDLTKIEGIGPKVSKVLANAGITTFAGLIEAGAKKVDSILDAAGLHMMDSAGWIEQAKLAAMADWEKLLKLQNELKGGRKVK